jgi:hypothetical protein
MLQPIGRKKLNFVVVGTGRCGTVYFAKLLSEIGLPCGHERIFGPRGLDQAIQAMKKGGEDSMIAQECGHAVGGNHVLADSSYMAVPYLDHKLLSNAVIIHAVRNPFDVILSFHNKLQYFRECNSVWERFINSHMPEIMTYKKSIMRSCCYVLKWNQWIERLSIERRYIRVRLEHDTNMLLDYLKVPTILRPELGIENSHERWSTKMEPLKHPATVEDIKNCGFGSQIEIMAKNYGY